MREAISWAERPMRVPWLIVVVILLASSGAAVAAPPKSAVRTRDSARPWRELTSDHFVLKTDLSSSAARKLIAQMEFSRAGLVQAFLDGRDERPTRLEVVAFSTARGYAPYAGEHGEGAFFEHRGGAERIVLGPFPDHLRALHVSHELVHHLSYSRVPLQPSWLREGMAEFYSSVSRPSARAYVAGLPFEWLLAAASEERATTRDLLAWRGNASNRGARYAWSWLLVHFLVNRHPDALRELLSRLAAFEDPPLLSVRPSTSAPLPPTAAALGGAAHGVPFPDAAADKLVVAAAFVCTDDACTARLGASPAEPPSSDTSTNQVPSVDVEPR